MALTTDQEAKAVAFFDVFNTPSDAAQFATTQKLQAQKDELALQIANQRAAMAAQMAAGQATLDGLLVQQANLDAAIANQQAQGAQTTQENQQSQEAL